MARLQERSCRLERVRRFLPRHVSLLDISANNLLVNETARRDFLQFLKNVDSRRRHQFRAGKKKEQGGVRSVQVTHGKGKSRAPEDLEESLHLRRGMSVKQQSARDRLGDAHVVERRVALLPNRRLLHVMVTLAVPHE